MKRQTSVGWLALASILAMTTATTLMAADSTEISAKARKEGMAKTPALIQTTGINCTLTEARLIESGSRRSSFAGSTLSMSSGGSDGGGGGGPPPESGGGSSGGGDGGGGMPGAAPSSSIPQYEVACSEGLGYVISAPKGKTPEATLCLEMDSTNSAPLGGGTNGGPGGPSSGQNRGMGSGGIPPNGQSSTNQSKCLLPGNANQIAGLVPFIAKARLACSITKVRGVGHTASNAFFEVACDDNTGYLLATSLSPNANKEVQSSSCAELPANSNIRCTLSDPNAALLVADQLMAKSDQACKVTERRLFGNNDLGEKFFEVACEQGTGYVVQQTASGDFGQAITCADIGTLAGGCQLAGNKQ